VYFLTIIPEDTEAILIEYMPARGHFEGERVNAVPIVSV